MTTEPTKQKKVSTRKASNSMLRINRNSNVDNVQDIVNDINVAVSGKYIICHVSDSEFKTKEIVLKGIYPEEDIAQNWRMKVMRLEQFIKQHKNEILDPNTAIKLDRLTFQDHLRNTMIFIQSLSKQDRIDMYKNASHWKEYISKDYKYITSTKIFQNLKLILKYYLKF
ncbi:hypothetical protein RFI_36731 [Reticulomyxa filosa]|uniref:Uncharacterized protein n=1 Tax=Reticulomyxa filosa TaxID=46433 RepID=X6LHU0_RETFI|nr:hypothetical protein RFI_36731 [Reticulomyxa filosa]|eukprot:ETO00707.1 hypothetical protein RFI_36731 [Reticulomyxa filosa]